MFLVRNPAASAFRLHDDYIDMTFAPASAPIDLELFFTHESLYYSSQAPNGALWLALQSGDLLRRNNTNTADIPFGPGTGPNTALYDAVWRYSPNEGQWEALVGTQPIPSSTNRYVTELDFGMPSTISTIDATPDTLYTLSVPNNSNMMVTTRVVAARTGGTAGAVGDSASFIRVATVKNIAGTLFLKIVESAYTFRDQPTWNVFFEVSGTDIRVRVRGAVDNNVTWFGKTAGQTQNF